MNTSIKQMRNNETKTPFRTSFIPYMLSLSGSILTCKVVNLIEGYKCDKGLFFLILQQDIYIFFKIILNLDYLCGVRGPRAAVHGSPSGLKTYIEFILNIITTREHVI